MLRHQVAVFRRQVNRPDFLPAPVVGHLDLTFEAMELPADPGLTLLAYTAEPDSPPQDALNLLASWAAILDQAERAHTTGRG